MDYGGQVLGAGMRNEKKIRPVPRLRRLVPAGGGTSDGHTVRLGEREAGSALWKCYKRFFE